MTQLALPVLIPFAAGLLILIAPRALKELIGLAGAVAAVWFAGVCAFGMGSATASWVWFTVGNISFSLDLRVDRLSGFILFAASVFTVLIVLYSIGYMRGRERLKEYYGFVLLASGAAASALLADNLLILLVGWEISTVLLFYLITIGGADSRDAAGKTYVMIGFSDCALLLGIALLWQMTGTMRISAISGMGTGSPLHATAYILLLIGALVKAGAMPGHSWIPKAAETAPTSVMAFLPASIDKLLGIYLLARISLDMFVIGGTIRLLLMTIGATTIIIAVMLALVQHNMKKLLAFHAVSQVGYMVLGIGTGVPAGIVGGLFHMLNNAIYKCCLFLGAGAVEKRTGTVELERLGGLAKNMPLTFGAMLVAAFSISGIPPFNGFASKWLVYQGTVESAPSIFLIAAMFGSALTLASFIKVIHSVFLGKRPDALANTSPAGWTMGIPMLILAALCVVFGVFAQFPLRHLIGPAAGLEFSGAPGAISDATAIWSPTLATVLLLVALAVGIIIYAMNRVFSGRRTTIFVGGEQFKTEDARFPGTGFYRSIETMYPLQTIYRDAGQGVYDLYVLGGAYGLKIVNLLRAVHNGVVSTYVAFSLVGLGFLVFFFMR